MSAPAVVDTPAYKNAKQALVEYKTVDQVKDFRDKALAVEAYAKQANDFELEWDAARARVRAERRCGELLAELEKGKKTSKPDEAISPYREARENAGLSNDQASKFQKLAAVPEEEFEKAVESPAAKPSTNHILKTQRTESKPDQETQRMDQDALWLWGLIKDMRSRGIFHRSLQSLVDEWTPGMASVAEPALNDLRQWMNENAREN